MQSSALLFCLRVTHHPNEHQRLIPGFKMRAYQLFKAMEKAACTNPAVQLQLNTTKTLMQISTFRTRSTHQRMGCRRAFNSLANSGLLIAANCGLLARRSAASLSRRPVLLLGTPHHKSLSLQKACMQHVHMRVTSIPQT